MVPPPQATLLVAWDPLTNSDLGWLTLTGGLDQGVVARLQFRRWPGNQMESGGVTNSFTSEELDEKLEDLVANLQVPNEMTLPTVEVKGKNADGDALNRKDIVINQEYIKVIKNTKEKIKISLNTCTYCRSSIRSHLYPAHLREVHLKDPEDVKVSCPHCHDMVFSLKCHKSSCPAAKEECALCSRRFYSKKLLAHHVKVCHGLKLDCPKCGKMFANKCSLKTHTNLHGEDWYTVCKRCNKKIAKNSLLRHDIFCKERYEVLPSPSGDFPRYVNCKMCSKIVQRSAYLRHLKNIHKVESEWTDCRYCMQTMNSETVKVHEECCKLKLFQA